MRIPDRQLLRREYLKKKAAVASKSIGGHLVFAGGMIFTVMCVAAAILCTFAALIAALGAPAYWPYCAGGALVLALFAFIGSRTVRAMDRYVEAVRGEADISYVPPVTPDTLPAEEVLMRGAERPQEDTVLLRPSTDSVHVPDDELLRAAVDKGE